MTTRQAVTATLAGAAGTGAGAGAAPMPPTAQPADTAPGRPGDPLPSRLAALAGSRARLEPDQAWIAEGNGQHLATPVRVWTVAGSGRRFVREMRGDLPRVVRFDGEAGTATDLHGLPYPLEMSDLDAEIVTMLVWTGEWLYEDSGVGIAPGADGAEHRVRLTYRDTPFEAELELDPRTLRPLVMERRGFEGLTVTTFSDFRPTDGAEIAHEITREIVVGDVRVEDERMRYTSVTRMPIGADAFAPVEAPRGARGIFDASVSAVVPIRFAATGHLLIDVEIDGRLVGPFILDSGAGATGISPETAEELGLPVVGASPITSMFGLAKAPVHRAGTLTVGPVTIADPRMFAMDMSPLSSVFGVEVRGVVGFDLLQRARAILDVSGARLTLEDPATPSSGTGWRELHVHGRTPVVAAHVGTRELLFRLDAGASGDPVGNVMFNVATAETLGLAERPDGDTVSFEAMRLGTARIDHLDLAGHAFENLDVFFAEPGCEVIVNDPYVAGNIGVDLLRPFEIVFDYPARRIAFVPRVE